jgi:hypothetical protein
VMRLDNVKYMEQVVSCEVAKHIVDNTLSMDAAHPLK